MTMGNEPVNPGEQSNDKQNEDTAATLLALAGLAGLAWLARKKTQARQVAEPPQTDLSAKPPQTDLSAENFADMMRQRAWDDFMQKGYGR